MWPWEHLAIGYVAYSLLTRGRTGEPPSNAAAVAVAVGTQFPDLIDKPLGWVGHVTSAGLSVAHSALVAVPLSVVVVLVATRYERAAVGVAFAVGYLTHLPGDVFYPVLLGGEPKLWFLWWPFVDVPASNPRAVLPYVGDLFTVYRDAVTSRRGLYYLGLELVLLAGGALLWAIDRCPPLGVPRATRR
jgi:hypothetical protein